VPTNVPLCQNRTARRQCLMRPRFSTPSTRRARPCLPRRARSLRPLRRSSKASNCRSNIYIYIYIYICIYIFIFIFIFIFIYMYIYIYIYPWPCLALRACSLRPLRRSSRAFICRSNIYIYIHIDRYIFIYSFIYSFIYLYIF